MAEEPRQEDSFIPPLHRRRFMEMMAGGIASLALKPVFCIETGNTLAAMSGRADWYSGEFICAMRVRTKVLPTLLRALREEIGILNPGTFHYLFPEGVEAMIAKTRQQIQFAAHTVETLTDQAFCAGKSPAELMGDKNFRDHCKAIAQEAKKAGIDEFSTPQSFFDELKQLTDRASSHSLSARVQQEAEPLLMQIAIKAKAIEAKLNRPYPKLEPISICWQSKNRGRFIVKAKDPQNTWREEVAEKIEGYLREYLALEKQRHKGTPEERIVFGYPDQPPSGKVEPHSEEPAILKAPTREIKI